MKSSNAAIAAVLVLSALSSTSSIAEAFDPSDILTPDAQTPMWEGITSELWSHIDHGCDSTARIWWRMVFHDCGTYDKDSRTGGCDGSLQHELDRFENEDFPDTIELYRSIIGNWAAAAEEEEPTASMADVIIAGGLLAIKTCQGPTIRFTPYRKDAGGANGEGLLPGRFTKVQDILAMMRRASFNTQQSVALVGAGHTIAFFENEHRLDATPDKFDNKFFKELADKDFDGKLESDVVMMDNSGMKNWINLFARSEREFTKQAVKSIEKMINLIPWSGYESVVQRDYVEQYRSQASS